MNQPIKTYDDLYDVWYTPFWQKPIFIVGMIFIGVMLVSVFYFVIKKYKQKKVYLSPFDEALQLLYSLHVSTHNNDFLRSAFYFKLTAILKSYLSKTYNIALYSKTDDEVIQASQEILSKSMWHDLQQVFQGALYIKFAQSEATTLRMEQDLQRVKKIILNTKTLEGLDTSGKLKEQ